MAIRHHQPFKLIWVLFAVTFNAIRLPFWLIKFIPSGLRQHKLWSYKQALLVRILRAYLNDVWTVEMKTPMSLEPGRDGNKFKTILPSSSSNYVGAAVCDPEIKPIEIGGTWYPLPPTTSGTVILHFHGGAYVIGDGRAFDAGFAAKTLIDHTPATHVFCPQYRLASNPLGRFPAALQDAITSYVYLTETLGISANRIVVSGDSAGGNLCLSLLRYIADNPNAGLAAPACALLWSPWVNPSDSLIPGYFDAVANTATDYITDGFGAWGARCYTPAQSTGLTLQHENIRFLGKAFETPTPLFFSAGECEVLLRDVVKLEGEFREKGNKTALEVEKNAVHDIILAGFLVGFEEEARLAAKKAGKFLETVLQ